MKRENVSATFQGFRDFILRASKHAGRQGKLHITANIILEILKILQILLLSILQILRASKHVGRREKRLIIANIILEILKILKILLLSCKISPNVVNYNYEPKGDCAV